MTLHTLTKEQFVPAPVETVFGFFSRPENLSKLTPPGLGFVILTPPPIEMKKDALIDYTIRLLGIRVRWTTLITAYEAGSSFVDEQLKGPYSYWHHSHVFESAPGGTIVRDRIRYALPFGPVGRLVHSLAVRNQLEEIFDFRVRVIDGIFREGGTPVAVDGKKGMAGGRRSR
jgi:ligand-binding SRPBCC domain-containing protein